LYKLQDKVGNYGCNPNSRKGSRKTQKHHYKKKRFKKIPLENSRREIKKFVGKNHLILKEKHVHGVKIMYMLAMS